MAGIALSLSMSSWDLCRAAGEGWGGMFSCGGPACSHVLTLGPSATIRWKAFPQPGSLRCLGLPTAPTTLWSRRRSIPECTNGSQRLLSRSLQTVRRRC